MILGSGVPHDTKGIVSAEINGGSEVVCDPRYVNSGSVGPGLEDLAIAGPGYCISGEPGGGLEDLSIVPG